MFENLSEENAKNKEVELIREYNAKVPNGYNITEGGDGSVGYRATLETRRKLSKSHLGQRAWNKGIKSSIETRDKISQINKELWKMPEHREKMSQAHMGFTHTPETREKISKNHNRKRQVVQVDSLTGQMVKKWDTIKDALNENVVSSSAISNCCAERTLCYKGYVWMYLEDCSPSNIERRINLVGKRRIKK